MRLALLVFAAGVLTLPYQAMAISYCSEPSEPSCVRLGTSFRSEIDFNFCRNHVERFRSEVRDYGECLRRKESEAVEELNRVIRKFNCLASGERFCL
jgi:hypothetical protein